MGQKKKTWNVGILFCLVMTVAMLFGSVSVQADTKGTTYYRYNYRVIDMNNQLVEEVVLHEGETLVFTIGGQLEDGTYEALGDNYSFSGEEWRITTWTHPIEGYSGLSEWDVEWCYENEHVKVWEELATNKRVICVKGVGVTDASDDYNLTLFVGTDYSRALIEVSVPITVLPAESGVTYPSAGDERPYDLFDSKEEAYQYIRKLIGWHINEEITACYPIDDVDSTEIGYDIHRVLGFYTDQIGMNPSGDYLYNSGAGRMSLDGGGTVTWRGEEYQKVTVDYSGWTFNTTYEQETWVADTIEALWADGGALAYARNGSDYDKVMACMKWIDENTYHQLSYEGLTHSAYSALNRGYATCEGLALLLNRMLSEVGVPNRIIMEENSGAHTYNIVLLNGKYYYCDPTTGETLKGSDNFTCGTLNWKYQDKDFQNLILNRVSTTDYDPGNGWHKNGATSYWYENGVKQGTYDDPQGVLGDGTVRGREIYDPVSDGWYWLDAVYDGAKAINKEVWMPYIYQDEAEWEQDEIRFNAEASGDMAEQVIREINNRTGKWVRYDENGKMYKGWYTVEGAQAEIYPDQVGNTYYYDHRTGLMAKGEVEIDGVTYYFDPITGVLQQ